HSARAQSAVEPKNVFFTRQPPAVETPIDRATLTRVRQPSARVLLSVTASPQAKRGSALKAIGQLDRETLKSARQVARDAAAHREVEIDRLLEKLRCPRGRNLLPYAQNRIARRTPERQCRRDRSARLALREEARGVVDLAHQLDGRPHHDLL